MVLWRKDIICTETREASKGPFFPVTLPWGSYIPQVHSRALLKHRFLCYIMYTSYVKLDALLYGMIPSSRNTFQALHVGTSYFSRITTVLDQEIRRSSMFLAPYIYSKALGIVRWEHHSHVKSFLGNENRTGLGPNFFRIYCFMAIPCHHGWQQSILLDI